MHAQPVSDSPRATWWHLLLVLAVSSGYESLFLHHGLNLFDEGWPLYAAMRLHHGGTLYRDVFFPFPPGHLLPAWIAYGLDPPGIALSRSFYAGFNALVCAGIYLLGRRSMPPSFALLGALLLAVAAPRSHASHLLFGYRYLIFSILSLLLFSLRLRSGNHRWMLPAGLCAGVALSFRLTPAFAVSCALALASMAADGAWRSWLRDWSWFALGLLLVAAPVLGWFALGVGLEAVWQQVVVHIVALQEMQSRPVPELILPSTWADREGIHRWFTAVQYRLYAGLYCAYAAVLAVQWIRARVARRPFPHALLLAVVVWGGIYLLRTLGRSDEPHLDSALPPACLLLAHLAHLGFRRLRRAGASPLWRRRWVGVGMGLAALGAWVFLLGTDVQLGPSRRGIAPLQTLAEPIYAETERRALMLDRTVTAIRRWTEPGDRILDLSASPLFYVLTDRLGPGGSDIIMPGTFLDEHDERAFLERLEQSPPAAVIWPRRRFDKMTSRALLHTAPLVREWVMSHYRAALSGYRYSVLLPLDSPHLPRAASGGAPADPHPGSE